MPTETIPKRVYTSHNHKSRRNHIVFVDAGRIEDKYYTRYCECNSLPDRCMKSHKPSDGGGFN